MRDIKRISTIEIAEALKINRVTAWRKMIGLSPLKADEAAKLAEYYNVSVGEIIEVFEILKED